MRVQERPDRGDFFVTADKRRQSCGQVVLRLRFGAGRACAASSAVGCVFEFGAFGGGEV